MALIKHPAGYGVMTGVEGARPLFLRSPAPPANLDDAGRCQRQRRQRCKGVSSLARCSLTCLTFALHGECPCCALRRFIDVDRVTSRGPNAFNYNTLLPNKSTSASASLSPALKDSVQFWETLTYFMTELCIIPAFLSLSPPYNFNPRHSKSKPGPQNVSIINTNGNGKYFFRNHFSQKLHKYLFNHKSFDYVATTRSGIYKYAK